MSAHAGIFHRDGAPSHASELDVCLPFLDRLGPEGGSTHVAGCVSFAHRIYRVTPESFEERQPLIDARGLISTWDGRIDNREDLALQLRETERWLNGLHEGVVIAGRTARYICISLIITGNAGEPLAI